MNIARTSAEGNNFDMTSTDGQYRPMKGSRGSSAQLVSGGNGKRARPMTAKVRKQGI